MDSESEMAPAANKSFASARFRLIDWMACGPGLESREDWTAWLRDEELHKAEAVSVALTLPTMLRRRISVIGQMAFRASYALLENRIARFIFCSRHGEFQRTLNILKSLAAQEPVSPAEFSLSVHNALAGLLSIAWKNTAGHTTISAGADSFGAAMLDAIACLKSQPAEPVMVVYFDDLLPEPYDTFNDRDDTCLALAMLLGAPPNDGEDLTVSFEPCARETASLSATEQALDFLRFILSGESERISIGERLQWRWQRGA
ncbi:MAG TPA: beta-ketoacyl synthase chain length factor [Candidatus Binataceae bacterium]|nr:beta-ketoacyl synthase chain length factor [Candidatus Binataceae bacterium]